MRLAIPDPKIAIEDLDRAPGNVPGEGGQLQAAQLLEAFKQVSADYERLQTEFDTYKREQSAETILNSLITPTANRSFYFMCLYCFAVYVLLFLNALAIFQRPIEAAVLVSLVGSTAVTVIGLVGMVITGIFVGARERRKG